MARTRSVWRWVGVSLAAVVVFVLVGVGAAVVTFWLEPVATLRTVQQWQIDGALGSPTMVQTPAGEVATWTAGEGPTTIVLVHGFGDNSAGWVAVATALAQEHRVVVVDLPGHGRSDPDAAPLAFATVYDGLDGALSSIDGPLVLVGNSLGGWLAAKWTTEHPDRVRALYLVNAGGLPRELNTDELLPADVAGMRAKMRIILGEHEFNAPDFVVNGLVQMHADPRLHSLLDDVKRTPQHVGLAMSLNTTPLTFVWGTPDAYFPVDPYLGQYQALRPDAKTVLLDGCGHAPQYSCPDQLVEAVLNR